MSPRTQALAFRIWAYASPKGWDVSAHDIAEALDVEVRRVHYVLAAKGWNARTRSTRGESRYATLSIATRKDSEDRSPQRGLEA